AWHRRGYLRLLQKRHAEALADLDQAVRHDRMDPAAPLNRATLLRALHREEEAEAAYGEAIRRDGLFVEAWLERGVLRAKLGRSEEAEADFSRALELDPKNARAAAERAVLRSARGDFDGAAADLDAAAASNAGAAGVAAAYASAYAGRWEEALVRFRAVAGRHEYAHLWIWLLEVRLGRRAQADAALRAARRARGKDDWFATVADALTGDLTEEALLKAAATGDPKTVREQTCEACFYAGMRRLLVDADREGARALLERAVASDVREFVEHTGARAELRRMK
ncbi:MAG TPA: tetratricopeptide repeat protein, partial [Planctomycetota bacterium]|nr:tetratricopeptide repeat protein [Planctomycetota bacterium]